MKSSCMELEMGYTPSEFRKTLQGQFIDNTDYSCKEINSREWLLTIDGEHQGVAVVNIKISEAAPRIIAMLTLPVLKTHFQFNHVTEVQRENFINTFLRYFHKGGG